MTHTLHRRSEVIFEGEDFTILCMAAQGYNDKGAAEKLKEIYKLVASSSPDNLADDNLGGRYTGHTDEEILDHMGDKAYIGTTYTDRLRLKDVLEKFKAADLGMSVVVTGNYESVFQILKEVGLKPHTVNMSLGFFGKKERVPSEEILAVSTMCGHGMVTRQRIENIMEDVEQSKCSAKEGGEKLASTCTCGIFNPKAASEILVKITEK
jgi:hypothetical protein